MRKIVILQKQVVTAVDKVRPRQPEGTEADITEV